MSTFAFDVVVIDATGESTLQANALRRELGARGVRVKLDVIPRPGPAKTPMPVDALDDAANAACCVLLMPTKQGGLGYMAIPTPSKRGAAPVFAENDARAKGREIETGDVDSVAVVAERVVEMVRRVG